MERREAYPTDTQHIVNLSGYVWAASQLPDLSGLLVLDAACGTGYGTDYLAGLADRAVGIDAAPEVVARCRARYQSTNVAFIAMDGCRLGFRDATFDAIVSQDTIEHIVKDQLFVAELARVLRKDGVLMLFTPHGKGPGHVPEDPYHVREYAPDELHALLSPHFSCLRWFGRSQGARLKAVESHMDAVRRWDPRGLRRLVPRRLRHRIAGWISRARGGVALDHILPGDIEYREGFRDDTNLIVVCTK